MFEIMVEGSFAAAHRLLNYEGVCENQHGHNWKVQVYYEGESLDQSGIAIDFKILYGTLQEVLEKLDHTDLNTVKDLAGKSPSSEMLSMYIYKQIRAMIPGIKKVSVWETDKACATYWE
jgi:6-pyruvoyltetrahydropterin/6-carboxytetrahydropterin synthase